MSITRWQKPFGGLLDMYDRINKLFEEDLMGQDKDSQLVTRGWNPVADIYETKDEYVFKVELPGISKEDVKVELTGDNLTIKGERKEEKEVKKDDYHRVERFSGSFVRSFRLPRNADAQNMKAAMKEGVLELRIPKSEESKSKAIPIDIR
ncbi:MAG TPA: Hsp20/alpha crystallin family protein [Candidatus Deferrimicrobium sp.]|nr:Hsp20/alpha crystallin family protein [Candidatus Deferrimicrobium sp.]